MKRDVHRNSIDCYHGARLQLSAREAAVFGWLGVHGPATDREVMLGLGLSDPNGVRPRITELIDAGLVEEVGTVVCRHSRKRVRKVDVTWRSPQLSLLAEASAA